MRSDPANSLFSNDMVANAIGRSNHQDNKGKDDDEGSDEGSNESSDEGRGDGGSDRANKVKKLRSKFEGTTVKIIIEIAGEKRNEYEFAAAQPATSAKLALYQNSKQIFDMEFGVWPGKDNK